MIVLLRCTCEGITHTRHLTPQYLSRSCCILCIGRFFSSACSLADDFRVWVSVLSIYFPQVFRPLSCEDLSLGLLFSFNIIRLCCIALSLQCAKGRRLNHRLPLHKERRCSRILKCHHYKPFSSCYEWFIVKAVLWDYLLIQIKVFKWRVFLRPELCQNVGCFWLARFFSFYFFLLCDEKMSNSVFNWDRVL